MKFKELPFSSSLLDGLSAIGFEDLTPIQQEAIPHILDNKDIIACAQTGTGKTAAFLLPIMELMDRDQNRKGIQALIIAPTRELVMQIDQQVEGLSYFTPVNSFPIYGGNEPNIFDRQKGAIKEGCDILIATPGRLLQHINLGYVKWDHLKYLVLDEADRMLDMGFYEDIMRIIKELPKKKQSLLFSATFPPKIRKMAKEILQPDHAEVSIAISKPAEKIVQHAYMAYDEQKNRLVTHLLKGKGYKSLIIFASTKQAVKDLDRDLRKMDYHIGAIHSDLDQKEREQVMRDFKSGKVEVLVATDIVSRGIDVDGIELVINYNVPSDPEDYVHRIGRTARAEREGAAITLINPKDVFAFNRIEKLMERKVDKLTADIDLGPVPEYGKSTGGGNSHGNRSGGNKGGNRRPQGNNRPKNGKPSGGKKHFKPRNKNQGSKPKGGAE